MTESATTSFPRLHARTQRFTLGRPRSLSISPSGDVVVFLRARAGDDPVHDLWQLDTTTGEERLVAATADLPLAGDGTLSAAERARRERLREGGAGIVSYAADASFERLTFTVGGEVFVVARTSGEIRHVPVTGAAFDPRLSPQGHHLAVCVGDALQVIDLADPGAVPALVIEEVGVAWGRAEFIAAEEMGRTRGAWWLPDGSGLIVARVDDTDVPRWTIADPANPADTPITHAYPAAGSANADVTLWRVGLDGARTEIVWDRAAFPYLASVMMSERPLVQVQSRDQRRVQVLELDGASAVVRTSWEDAAWVELIPGTPGWAGDRLLTVQDRADHGPDGSRSLVLDGEIVTPAGWQIRSVVDADADRVVVRVSIDDPTQIVVAHVPTDGTDARVITTQQGVHDSVSRGDVDVIIAATLFQDTPSTEVRRGGQPVARITAVAERSGMVPDVRLLELGPDGLRAGLVLPRPEHDPGGPLPVLLDPYGGPHAQRVLSTRGAWLVTQWFADQGYAVLVTDGRGTPGRGPAFERAVHLDLAGGVLDDQIAALDAAAALEPRLDLTRVGIRGWSFGGFLAGLAVLRRPDRFHAAIVGAPVTDWRLYDTHYTERYLGHPDTTPEAYLGSSLIDAGGALVGAVEPQDGRYPGMLIIHGLADDNVVAAHSVRLSGALLAAGRPHEFLPLSGVTHMTPQEVVAEALLLHQVEFLGRHLRRV